MFEHLIGILAALGGGAYGLRVALGLLTALAAAWAGFFVPI